jgi:hypothetical protein
VTDVVVGGGANVVTPLVVVALLVVTVPGLITAPGVEVAVTVAASAAQNGRKRVVVARASDFSASGGDGMRMARLLSDRCHVRSVALQCVCQEA